MDSLFFGHRIFTRKKAHKAVIGVVKQCISNNLTFLFKSIRYLNTIKQYKSCMLHIRNVKSTYFKCIASQCISPPYVWFFLREHSLVFPFVLEKLPWTSQRFFSNLPPSGDVDLPKEDIISGGSRPWAKGGGRFFWDVETKLICEYRLPCQLFFFLRFFIILFYFFYQKKGAPTVDPPLILAPPPYLAHK